MNQTVPQKDTGQKRSFGCLHLAGIALLTALVAAAATAWWVKHYLYAPMHTPTELSVPERETLGTKMERLEEAGAPPRRLPGEPPSGDSATAFPEPYSEEGAGRDISITERELNGLIAEDPETAKKVAIDLSDDLVSLNIVAPFDEEVPLFGGKTLRLKAGVTLRYEEGRPAVILRGVSLGGIPIPNAWLGNIKNRDLVEEFGSEGGFWQLFADGVENIQVRQGHILIRLKE